MKPDLHVRLTQEVLRCFCDKWRITQFAVFGSVLREDFGQHSDVDVLVTFENDAPWSLWEMIEMRDELAELVHRDIDLVEKKAIRNPFRRKAILVSCRVLYDSGKV